MPRRQKIRVIADATEKTGFGHASRCLNIANAIVEAAPEIQIIFEGTYSEHARDRIAAQGFQAVGSGTDRSNDDLILHDRYGLAQHEVDCLRASAPILAFIDDFQLLDLSASDCVINFRADAENLFCYGSRNELLGLRYFPVPKGLHRVREAKLNAPVRTDRILVFVGGAATADDESSLARICLATHPEAEVVLVTQRGAKIPPHPRLRCEAPRNEISEFLAWADVLVCGGGLIKYEAGYCGIPTACVSQTEGQDQDTKILAKKSLTFDLGTSFLEATPALHQALETFFEPKTLSRIKQACLETYVENSDRHVAEALLGLTP